MDFCYTFNFGAAVEHGTPIRHLPQTSAILTRVLYFSASFPSYKHMIKNESAQPGNICCTAARPVAKKSLFGKVMPSGYICGLKTLINQVALENKVENIYQLNSREMKKPMKVKGFSDTEQEGSIALNIEEEDLWI
jgi:hypothetical protein